MQVTASKVELLLNCQRPFGEGIEISKEAPSEAMRYGSALHEALEHSGKVDFKALAAKWELSAECSIELHRHAVRTLTFLNEWLKGKNVFEEVFHAASRETHRATRLRKRAGIVECKTRECGFDVEEHVYDLRPSEFGGTDDLIAVSNDKRIVIDYKSGDHGTWHSPASLTQMLTLAIQTEATHVAILHTPRQGEIAMYCDPVDRDALQAHGAAILHAQKRIGDGSLRPGPWCGRCPAKEGCPSKDGELLTRSASMLAMALGGNTLEVPALSVDKGKFHVFLQEFDRLAKRAREALREEVRAGAIIARPDGKVLVLRKQEREGLSKASVVRAMGKAKGEKMLTKLRALGAVEKTTVEVMTAENE